MNFKKFSLFHSFLVLIPTQLRPFNFGEHQNLVFGGCCAAVMTLFGIAWWHDYLDKKEKQAEQEFWNNQSDDIISALITIFVKKVEDDFTELKAIRKAQALAGEDGVICTVKCTLESYEHLCKYISDCNDWINRLHYMQQADPKRELAHLDKLVRQLQTELYYMDSVIQIYVDADLTVPYEPSKNKYNGFGNAFDAPINNLPNPFDKSINAPIGTPSLTQPGVLLLPGKLIGDSINTRRYYKPIGDLIGAPIGIPPIGEPIGYSFGS